MRWEQIKSIAPRISLIIWAIFLPAFVGLSLKAMNEDQLPSLLMDGIRRRASLGAPYATTDRALEMLQTPQPSEAIRSAIAALPSDGDLLFVGTGNDHPSEAMHRFISYLIWPRRVFFLGCGWHGHNTLQDRVHVAGIIYYLSKPPDSVTSRVQIGPHLILVPVTHPIVWTDYCNPS